MLLLGIATAGALGALARFGLTTLGSRLLTGSTLAGFPLGTLVVNVLGSFLLGVVASLAPRSFMTPAVQLALATGFLGSLTTFSTFELESVQLIDQGKLVWAAAFVVGNLILGLLALLAGNSLALGSRGPDG